MSKHIPEQGIVEYFEGLVKYMRKLGYEDPRDKRIKELETELKIFHWMKEPANGFHTMIRMGEEEYEAQHE